MPDGSQRAASAVLSGPSNSSPTVTVGNPGPGPIPNPWLQNGAQVYYDQGGVTAPHNVTGGDKGVGSFNAQALYVNGVAVALVGGEVVQITQGTGIILTPNPLTTTGTIAVDTGVIATQTYVNTNLANYLPLTGGTLTGLLTLSGAPTANLHAATKLYVDNAIAGVPLANYLPLTGGTLTGALNVNAPIKANATTAAPAGGTAGVGYMLGSTANFGVMFGTGAPNKAAPVGTLYLRGDGTGQPSVNSDGTATGWVPLGGGASIFVSDTPPPSPQPNALWWKSDIGQLFLYYQDPNTTQWVPAAPAPTVGASPSPGMIMDFAGATPPAGWLICDGSAVSRTAFAALFGVIGTTYGVGDNSTTFNLPDCRGRVTAGPDGGANRLTSAGFGGTAAVAAVGGGETQTLSWSQMPNHAHTMGGGAAMLLGNAGTAYGTTVAGGNYVGYVSTMDPSGSSAAHQNVQPTIIMNKIIKT